MRKTIMRRLQPVTLAAVVVFCAGFGGLEQLFAPKAELWPRWQAHDAKSVAVIGHQAWDALLKRYIRPGPDAVNLFSYKAVTKIDKLKLDSYVAALKKTSIDKYNRQEQRAYWINLYNALTVKVVLDHYPVKSIRDIDISPGFLAKGPWDKKLITVEGEPLSLNDIEHRILRPIWQDNRIHYAVNCASIGCPNLQSKAYTGANAEGLLALGAQQYINSPRGVSVKDGSVTISKIFNWYQPDFGETEKGVLSHLTKYAAPALQKKLKGVEEVSGFAYDWRLNEAP